MIDSTKPKMVAIAASSLSKTQPEESQMTLHCWEYRESRHTKNDPNFPKKKKARYLEKPKQKIEMAKTWEKSKKK